MKRTSTIVRQCGSVFGCSLAIGGIGCGASEPPTKRLHVNHEQDAPRHLRRAPHGLSRIDEMHGTYGGVGLESSTRAVEAIFGPAPPWKATYDPAPLDAVGEATGATYNCGDRKKTVFLRYRGVSFWVYGGGVCEVQITDSAAKTLRGRRVGESLALVRRSYPALSCGRQPAEGYTRRFCTGRVAFKRFIWFGGDPINDIELGNRRFKP